MLHVNIMSHVAAISLYRYSINYLIKRSFIFSSWRQVLKLFFFSLVILTLEPVNLIVISGYNAWLLATCAWLMTILLNSWLSQIQTIFTFLQYSAASLRNKAFSHDVTSAILVFQNNKMAAMLAKPVFCSNKFPWLLVTWTKTFY